MNDINNGANSTENSAEIIAAKRKKNKKIIIGVFAGSLVLTAVCALIPGLLGESGKTEYETYPPLPPHKLYETYEDGFEILEYEEYLKFDRNVYLYGAGNSTKTIINEKTAKQSGKDIALVYDILAALIAGDVDRYNEMVVKDLERDWFSQQQLYRMAIGREKEESFKENGKTYTEYVVKVEYMIHENNGSYRNNIESDAMRVQYFYIDDRAGELKVTAIVEPYYKNAE